MSYRDDGLDLDAIRRINNTVVNDDGTVKSFKEQLLEYEYGYYKSRVSVNEFLSVYERANIEFTIRKTREKGLNLYPNEKTRCRLFAAHRVRWRTGGQRRPCVLRRAHAGT